MERPVLTRVMRGYDARQVDALLDRVWPALTGTEQERAQARAALTGLRLDVVLRGYDKREVHDLLRRLQGELGPTG